MIYCYKYSAVRIYPIGRNYPDRLYQWYRDCVRWTVYNIENYTTLFISQRLMTWYTSMKFHYFSPFLLCFRLYVHKILERVTPDLFFFQCVCLTTTADNEGLGGMDSNASDVIWMGLKLMNSLQRVVVKHSKLHVILFKSN